MLEIAAAEARVREVANLTLLLCDGPRLPLPAASVDVVLSVLVLQHVPSSGDVKRYIAEFGRILKPGGLAYFQLPLVPNNIYGRIRGSVLKAVVAVLKAAVASSALAPEKLQRRSPAFLGSRLTLMQLEDAMKAASLQPDSWPPLVGNWSEGFHTYLRAQRV
jgi:ubiquinone/menaquinone biosynthesis C-methylase UbiE